MKNPTMDSLRQMVSNQQHNELHQETKKNTEYQPINSQSADWVWQQGAEIYGEQWVRENGEVPASLWILSLNAIGERKVVNGVEQIIAKRVTWPPNLTKFLDLAEDIDTDAAYDRFIKKEPANCKIERKTRNDCGYECRSGLSETLGRAKFRNTYLKWKKINDEDKWPSKEQYMISEYSQVKASDRLIEDRLYSDRPKTDLEIRIDRMRAGL